MVEMFDGKFLIDGEWSKSDSGSTIRVLNPATGQTIGEVPNGSVEDTKRAIDAASQALSKWREFTPHERARILFEGARLIKNRSNELGRLLTMEQGKPLSEATGEVIEAADGIEFYAEAATKMHGSVISSEIEHRNLWVQKEPMGIVGIIIPWNYPAAMFSGKAGPALATGNTVVLKPASNTPLTNLEMARAMVEAGIPKGVLNVVTGPGPVVGNEIAKNSKISKVTFTGETETGKQVMRLASDTLKRISLELGGNDPMIVCEDADLELAATGAANGRYGNCGQDCVAPKRLYVHKSVAEKFIKLFLDRVNLIRVGNGLDPETTMGPLNNSAQRADVERLVRDAKDRGAEVLSGGKRPEGESYANGFFYEPTVLVSVPDGSLILREECFGPALPIVQISDMQEGIEKANDSIYGLGASIWTKDVTKAMDAIGQLQAGTVWVNACSDTPINVPFGGIKQSGFGRDHGTEALEAYCEMKSVTINSKRSGQ